MSTPNGTDNAYINNDSNLLSIMGTNLEEINSFFVLSRMGSDIYSEHPNSNTAHAFNVYPKT